MSSNCSDKELRTVLEQMILSPSGWRKVFAPDGEHGRGKILSFADRCLAAAMGVTFGRWLAANCDKKRPAVLVATDSRPTGEALSDFLMRGLCATRCRIIFIGIAAVPEAMAFCRNTGGIAGVAYVSASHNPLGYNGVKFSTDGSVIGGLASAALVEEFRKLVMNESAALMKLASGEFPEIRFNDKQKKRCLRTYARQLSLIAGGPESGTGREIVLKSLRQALSEKPLAVVADLNGSARCLSADRMHIESLGAKLYTFNKRPGRIEHAILPEGRALEPCKRYLEELHARGARFGYVPDNDGDRGNLVIWDDYAGSARILEAQEVFAITVLADFACAAWMGNSAGQNVALVVNGPTSHRVRPIAEAYGASVFEAEVGESNVVNLGRELRRKGYIVRLLGEGSNGGVIVHPAQVRDPLNTVSALLKLLRLPKMSGHPNPFEDWCQRSGQSALYREDYGAADILASLPAFTTSSASAENSKMKIACTEHGVLKTEWEGIFNQQWAIHGEALREVYGFCSWIQLNNSGINSRQGSGLRKPAFNGGLKIIFRDRMQRDAGFLWMRSSGTEPVFRLMVEIRGARPEAEASLIVWHRAMISEADRLATGARFKEIPIPGPTNPVQTEANTESSARVFP